MHTHTATGPHAVSVPSISAREATRQVRRQYEMSARAKARGADVGQLVNELLSKDIELIEAAR